jgi:HisA/HisF family protein
VSELHIRVAVDIKDGIYVYATGGNRERYLPPDWLQGKALSPSEALYELNRRFGANQFYMADLDAIGGRTEEVLGRYRRVTRDVWLDLGVHSDLQWHYITSQLDLPLILCTETTPVEEWLALTRLLRFDDIISLDYREGNVRFLDTMVTVEALPELLQSIKLCTRVLFLDLDRVGSQMGPQWDIIGGLRRLLPRVWVGGGIRDHRDLSLAEELRIEGIVMATGVFNGSVALQARIEKGRSHDSRP